MPKFTSEFLACISGKEINHIKAGSDREKFTGIWMVVVNDRVFARSYYLSEKSWYTTLLDGEMGEIKCDKTIIAVRGVRPRDLTGIADDVNEAYSAKYGVKKHNVKWVEGLCEAERVEKTMEFIPV